MLGIVFTEFAEMVEEKFSPELLDTIIEEADLDAEGIYTSVGYYDHNDLVKMVVLLSQHVDMPVDDLVQAFGEHLFGILIGKYPVMGDGLTDTLSFLETVDSKIHIEVKKLYPNSELPTFDTERLAPDHLKMTYTSKRPFSQLALGLMKGSAKHFGESIDVKSESFDSADSYKTVFDIKVSNA